MSLGLKRRCLKMVFVLLSLGLTYTLFTSLFVHLWQTWKVDPFYQHSPWGLVCFIILYVLAWKKTHVTESLRLEPQDWKRAALGFILTGLLLGAGAMTHLPFFGGLALFCWLSSLHILTVGWESGKYFVGSFFYLLLFVPLPYLNELSGLLQVLIAQATVHFLTLFGIPLSASGLDVILPTFRLRIAADCTGLTSWLVLMSVLAFFLGLIKGSSKRKVILFVLIIPIALLSNFIRVQALFIVGFLYGEGAALRFWHDFSGWMFYLLACLLAFLVFLGVGRGRPTE